MPVGLGCVDKPNVLSEMVFGDVPDPRQFLQHLHSLLFEALFEILPAFLMDLLGTFYESLGFLRVLNRQLGRGD